jgi:hypothetical protein
MVHTNTEINSPIKNLLKKKVKNNIICKQNIRFKILEKINFLI